MPLDITNGLQPSAEGYAAPACFALGDTKSSLFQPPGFSLWELDATLGRGCEVRWNSDHGDEAVYVLEGMLGCSGVQCGPATILLVEAGAEAVYEAIADARVLHFGSTPSVASRETPSGAAPSPPNLRPVRLSDAEAIISDDGLAGYFYADGTHPTYRAAIFVIRSAGQHSAVSHSHSQDEIIHVVNGELQIGPQRISAGMSVAIPASHRYGFQSTAAFSFINFRRAVSTYIGKPGSIPIPETVAIMRPDASHAAQLE